MFHTVVLSVGVILVIPVANTRLTKGEVDMLHVSGVGLRVDFRVNNLPHVCQCAHSLDIPLVSFTFKSSCDQMS